MHRITYHGYALAGALALLTPALPAYAAPQTIQDYIMVLTNFVNYTLLPFIFALALLFFLVNVVRFFIIDGAEAGKREEARRFAIYSLFAFVFLISIWGIINIVLYAFNLDGQYPQCPDYNPQCGIYGYTLPTDRLL